METKIKKTQVEGVKSLAMDGSPCRATVYGGSDFTGWTRTFHEGSYDWCPNGCSSSDETTWLFPKSDISSLHVFADAGCKATVALNSGERTLEEGAHVLAGEIASLRVDGSSSCFAILFSEPDFTGTSTTFPVGTYGDSKLIDFAGKESIGVKVYHRGGWVAAPGRR